MAFSYDDSWEQMTRLLEDQSVAKTAWEAFIDYHAANTPQPYWNTIRQLDIDGFQSTLTIWLHDLVISAPLPTDIIALWFGIARIATTEDGPEIPVLYLTGADTYEAEDIEWAIDAAYEPEDRYLIPPVLAELDKICQQDQDNYGFLDWILPLALCAFVVDDCIRSQFDKSLLLTHQPLLRVSIGYDGGDFVAVSALA